MSFAYQGAAGGAAAVRGVGVGGMAAGGMAAGGMAAGGMAAGGASGRVVAGGVGAIGGAGGGRVAPGSGGMVVGGVGGGVVAGGGGACATSEDCVAACVCAGPPGPATMSFVGWGAGDYITETNYKYVGNGQGDLALLSPARAIWGRVACASISLAVLLILLILLWPHHLITTTTTTPPHWTTTPPPHHGECTFWGDPHIKSFDGARPSFYGEGEAWVVKTSTVKIQARYRGTKYTKGLAATNKVAASANGHVIIVGTMESGDFTVDGQAVLTTFGSYNVAGVGKITYNGAGNLVDAAAGVWAKHVVHIELPHGIRLTVFRWNNYLDLRITMPAIPGMDGACGNFNGNAADDTTAAIQARIGARVGPGDLLFSHREEVQFTATEQQLIASCAPATYAKATQDCQAQLRGPHIHNQLKSCVLDRCWGSNEHTLRYAKGLGW